MPISVEVKGKQLVITADISEPPVPSRSAKTLVVASTRGNVTTAARIQGRPVVVGLNCYIYPDESGVDRRQ